MTRLHRGLVALALAAALPASAGSTLVIYRCVATDGSVTIQNGAKCPKGMREQKRVLDTPAPAAPLQAPARVAAPAPVAPIPTVEVPVSPTAIGVSAPAVDALDPAPPDTTATSRLPPPLLYACLTADAQRYFSDEAESSRCTPLQAVGLDGRSPAAGDACEVVQDRCEPIAEGERCAAWAERRRVAEQALTFMPEQVDTARAEIAHIDATVAGTACTR